MNAEEIAQSQRQVAEAKRRLEERQAQSRAEEAAMMEVIANAERRLKEQKEQARWEEQEARRLLEEEQARVRLLQQQQAEARAKEAAKKPPRDIETIMRELAIAKQAKQKLEEEKHTKWRETAAEVPPKFRSSSKVFIVLVKAMNLDRMVSR
jgi:hypothetical protein